MNTIQESAAVRSLGFMVGLFSQQDVIAWADSVIACTAEPSSELIELSLASGKHPVDVLHMLHGLAGHWSTPVPVMVVLGLLGRKLRRGDLSPMEVAQALNSLGDYPDEGHWPDILMNAEGEQRDEILERLNQHLLSFEHEAAAWEERTQPRKG